jgi:hypothetical protein
MKRRKSYFVAYCCMAFLLFSFPLAASERVGSVTVFSAQESAEFVFTHGGRCFIGFPGARVWELKTSENSWFPMSADEVLEAIREVDYPIDDLSVDIVILPVPRVGLVESSTEGSIVFLTPGRVPYPTEHIHYTVVHELGHAVHNAYMPDERKGLWRMYAGLRGMNFQPDGSGIAHADRAHEIFAEDFRALFGGDLARLGGRIENHDIAPPGEVGGLKEFFLWLPSQRGISPRVTVHPNPSAGEVAIKAGCGGSPEVVEEARVYDALGRLVVDLGGAWGSEGAIWDGRDGSGRVVAPGLYIIKGRVGGAAFAEKVIRVMP